MKKQLLIALMITATASLFAQRSVEGTVTDAGSGETLIGVTIQVKGTTSGTITDINGKYRLESTQLSESSVLVYSYIGYAKTEQVLGNLTVIDVKLISEQTLLDEVVVIGYGTAKKRDLLGAVSTVDGDKLNNLAVAGIDQALQGRTAGVNIAQNTGAPGEGVSVRIRGVGSVYGSNEPLYLVDGIPTKDGLNNISPSDIENVTILKDASSAAIYGSRATNGVVIITTKKGAKGANKIQFRSQFGIQTHGYLTPMTNRNEYVAIFNEAATNDNVLIPEETPFLKRQLISQSYADTLPDINYLEEIFRVASLQSYDFSISGGKEKTTYVASASYFDQEGIITGSGYNRATARININSEVKEWLTTFVSLNMYRAQTEIIGSSGDGLRGNGGSIVRYAFFRTPAIPIYDADGNFVDLPDQPEFFGDGYNPVGLAKYADNTRKDNGYNGKITVNIKLFEGLNFITNAGYDNNTFNRRRFNRNWGTNGRINNPNSLEVENNKYNSWTINNVLSYNKTFSEKHNLSVTLGTEAIKNEGYNTSTTDRGFADQSPNVVYLGKGSLAGTSSESKYASSLLSFFGRINYDYQNKYLFSVTLREDGSSRFAPGKRWGSFYSGSVAWVISKEAFFENVTFINNLKLRAGYGTNGNQEIPLYEYTDKIGINQNYPFGGISQKGYAAVKLGNENVTWEKSTQYNFGTDIGLWEGQLNLTADYFIKYTTDLLGEENVPASVGYATPAWVNNGKVLNRGLEIELEYRKKTGDFSYSIGGNIATLYNEVLEFNGFGTDPALGCTRTEKGHPISSFYLYEMEGIFQSDIDIAKHAFQSGVKPGDVKFKDQFIDGIIDEKDRVHIGSALPKFTAGLNLSCIYKNIDFSAFFQGSYGNSIYYQVGKDIEGFYRPFTVTKRYYDEHWTPGNKSNTQPRAAWSGAENNNRLSTRFLEDASYIRLKNVQIGYNLPKKITDKARIEKLRIYFTGTNMLTFTKYPGLDPEMTVSDNSRGEGDRSAGIDWGTYPAAISYNFGIELSF